MRSIQGECSGVKVMISNIAHVLDEWVCVTDSPIHTPHTTDEWPEMYDYGSFDDTNVTFEQLSSVLDEWVCGIPQSPPRIDAPSPSQSNKIERVRHRLTIILPDSSSTPPCNKNVKTISQSTLVCGEHGCAFFNCAHTLIVLVSSVCVFCWWYHEDCM